MNYYPGQYEFATKESPSEKVEVVIGTQFASGDYEFELIPRAIRVLVIGTAPVDMVVRLQDMESDVTITLLPGIELLPMAVTHIRQSTSQSVTSVIGFI